MTGYLTEAWFANVTIAFSLPAQRRDPATHLYGEAARGAYEDGAPAALLIVALGLLPAVVLTRLRGAGDRPHAAVP